MRVFRTMQILASGHYRKPFCSVPQSQYIHLFLLKNAPVLTGAQRMQSKPVAIVERIKHGGLSLNEAQKKNVLVGLFSYFS